MKEEKHKKTLPFVCGVRGGVAFVAGVMVWALCQPGPMHMLPEMAGVAWSLLTAWIVFGERKRRNAEGVADSHSQECRDVPANRNCRSAVAWSLFVLALAFVVHAYAPLVLFAIFPQTVSLIPMISGLILHVVWICAFIAVFARFRKCKADNAAGIVNSCGAEDMTKEDGK